MSFQSATASGYTSAEYAASLAEFGAPVALARSGGWVLQRSIPASAGAAPAYDAMGPYPLLVCRDWTGLQDDLLALAGQVVSLVAVPDPFGDYDASLLERSFDRVTPFKTHLVTDLSARPEQIVSKHHRYYARWALARLEVEECATPADHLAEWTALYGHLVARHALRGIKAFSPAAFARQLQVPGLVMFRALHEGRVVAAHLWYVQGETAYSHLTASSPDGYQVCATYALYWSALQRFQGRVRWLDLGAGASAGESHSGLDRFKRGWANAARPAYLCARVFDEQRYTQLVRASGTEHSSYFPAYRAGELV